MELQSQRITLGGGRRRNAGAAEGADPLQTILAQF